MCTRVHLCAYGIMYSHFKVHQGVVMHAFYAQHSRDRGRWIFVSSGSLVYYIEFNYYQTRPKTNKNPMKFQSGETLYQYEAVWTKTVAVTFHKVKQCWLLRPH